MYVCVCACVTFINQMLIKFQVRPCLRSSQSTNNARLFQSYCVYAACNGDFQPPNEISHLPSNSLATNTHTHMRDKSATGNGNAVQHMPSVLTSLALSEWRHCPGLFVMVSFFLACLAHTDWCVAKLYTATNCGNFGCLQRGKYGTFLCSYIMVIQNGQTGNERQRQRQPKLARSKSTSSRCRRHSCGFSTRQLPVQLTVQARAKQCTERAREREIKLQPHFSRCAGKHFVQFMKSY